MDGMTLRELETAVRAIRHVAAEGLVTAVAVSSVGQLSTRRVARERMDMERPAAGAPQRRSAEQITNEWLRAKSKLLSRMVAMQDWVHRVAVEVELRRQAESRRVTRGHATPGVTAGCSASHLTLESNRPDYQDTAPVPQGARQHSKCW